MAVPRSSISEINTTLKMKLSQRKAGLSHLCENLYCQFFPPRLISSRWEKVSFPQAHGVLHLSPPHPASKPASVPTSSCLHLPVGHCFLTMTVVFI